MMPGVPCIFWPHWKSYQSETNELIAVRKRVGIHSESKVLEENSKGSYSATIQGHRGKAIVRLGKNRSTEVPEGYELAVEGGDRGAYTVYVQMDPQGIEQPTSGSSLKGRGEKFLKDGKLYILHNGTMYNVQGKRVN